MLPMSAASAAGAAGAAAATAQAIRASGAIVHVEGQEFLNIVSREPKALVLHAVGGFLTTNYQYLTSYRGLCFYTLSPVPLPLPSGVELMIAKNIWVPGGLERATAELRRCSGGGGSRSGRCLALLRQNRFRAR
jgi:hypothetical protein